MKNVNLWMAEEAHEFLAELAVEAGASQGFVLQVLFEMLRLRIATALESGVIEEGVALPGLEGFVYLVAQDCGLLGDAEMRRAIEVADVMQGQKAKVRIGAMETLLNERREQLRPAWEAARMRREEERAENPLTRDASERVALAMLRAEMDDGA